MIKAPNFYAIPFVLILLLCSINSYSDTTYSGNPNTRDEYAFGMGTIVGGPGGILSLQADFPFLQKFSAHLGTGSGLYFDSYYLTARAYLREHKFSPYAGLGIARWQGVHSPENLAKNLHFTQTLGLVKESGQAAYSSLHVLPLAIGLHFLSEAGLSMFVEFEYLLSLRNIKATPYGAIGFLWYL